MEEKEMMLSKDLSRWVYFAENKLNMPECKAVVMWNNHHNKGKYLICESREDNSTRLYIRNVSNVLADYEQKNGWWNTFTVTRTKTAKGMWLAEVVEYRLDKNGFVNL